MREPVIPTCLICKHRELYHRRELRANGGTTWEYPCEAEKDKWVTIDDHCGEFKKRAGI
jgi:hypothetical protein